jgi:hypothetical protein
MNSPQKPTTVGNGFAPENILTVANSAAMAMIISFIEIPSIIGPFVKGILQ